MLNESLHGTIDPYDFVVCQNCYEEVYLNIVEWSALNGQVEYCPNCYKELNDEIA